MPILPFFNRKNPKVCEPNKGHVYGKEVGCTKSPIECELIIEIPVMHKVSKMLEEGVS